MLIDKKTYRKVQRCHGNIDAAWEVESECKIAFDMKMGWWDSRINFYNLKKQTISNVADVLDLWTAEIWFPNS